MDETAKANMVGEQQEMVRRAKLPWAEAGADEKIERLRGVVKKMADEMGELRRMLWVLRDTAAEHQHGANGQPVVAANRLDACMRITGAGAPTNVCMPGKEWF